MTMTTTIVFADPEVAALAWVNDCRAELGMPPLDRLPCGIRSSSGDCPIAHALLAGQENRFWPVRDVIVTEERATVASRDAHTWPTHPAVRRFIRAFDAGHYPHLLEFQR